MIHAFPPLRELIDGEFLGAETYLNLLVSRSHWLYGQAHALTHLQRQAWGQTTSSLDVWQAETYYRAEHSRLNFSARINLTAGGTATLAYLNSSDVWTNIATDANAGDRWFNGTEDNTFDCSTFDIPADGMLRVRLTITASGGSSSAYVYRAFMSLRTGLTSWPTLPTFADGAGNEPDAADYNALRTAQQYLYENAQKPNIASAGAVMSHTQESAYQPLMRWTFRHGCTQRLYIYLEVTNYQASEHVYLYLQDEKYPSSGSRLATLLDLTANQDTGHNIDLSGYGLTKGNRYSIEIGVLNTSGGDHTNVRVGTIYLHDLGGVTRTYQPKSDWVQGNQPTAAQLNTVKNDIAQMRDEAASESPLWLDHFLQPFQLLPPGSGHADPYDGGTGVSTLRYSNHRVRLCRRWRYLRWRGAGHVVSVDGEYEHTLSDSETAGEEQVLDLDSLEWLDYGMQYYIEDYGSYHLQCAHEDYS